VLKELYLYMITNSFLFYFSDLRTMILQTTNLPHQLYESVKERKSAHPPILIHFERLYKQIS